MTDITLMPLDVEYIVITKRQSYYSFIYDIELVYGNHHHLFRYNNDISPVYGEIWNHFQEAMNWLKQVMGEPNIHLKIELLNDPKDQETHSLLAWCKGWQHD